MTASLVKPNQPMIPGSSFVFPAFVNDASNPGNFKVAPTLASGDVKISVDGGAQSNISSLPTHVALGQLVVTLSGAETTGAAKDITVIFHDVAGNEWLDCAYIISVDAAATVAASDPDNASITAIKAKTDNLPGDPASNTQVNTRLASASYTAPDNAGITAIKAKTDNLPADPASNTQVNTRLASSAYVSPLDAAGTRSAIGMAAANLDIQLADKASLASVSALGAPMQASSYVAPDNSGITAIKAKTDNLPGDPASNTQVNTRLATASYTAPDNVSIAAIKTKTDNLPADPASNTQVNTRLATASYVAPDNAGITTIKASTDKLSTTLEPDGAVSRFTANALEMAPAGGGGGGGTDWTAGERAQIRDALGVDGDKSPSSGGVLQAIASWVGGILAAISGVVVTVVSPMLDGGEIELVRGDDYYAVDGRALTWNYKNGHDLSGASVIFNLGNIHAVCTVLNLGTSEQTIVCELSKAETQAISGSVASYTVHATLANTHDVTLYADMAHIS